jgi:hypothetical protein
MTAGRSFLGLRASSARALWGTRNRNIMRLGWTQLAVVGGALAAMTAVVGIVFERDLSEEYARRVSIKPFEAVYGFETGIILVRPPSGAAFEAWGILRVSNTGDFASLGVREGDIPFERHGGGAQALCHALSAASSGQAASFDVINAHDWHLPDQLREISVPARKR